MKVPTLATTALACLLLVSGQEAGTGVVRSAERVGGQRAPTAQLPTSPRLSAGQLAYVREDLSGQNVLYFSAPDGTNEHAIRTGVSSVVDWSASGLYLAVMSDSGVLVLDATGNLVGQIANSYIRHAVWSPQSDELLVESELPWGKMGLGLYAPDGSIITGLTAPDGVTTLYADMSWSPAGGEVLLPGCKGCNGTDFDAQPSTERHLWLLGGRSLSPVQLTNRKDVIEDGPRWSPDGSKILFSERCTYAAPCPADAFNGTFEMNRDGTHRHLMVDGYEARWSPDGRHLAFLRDEYTGSAISPVAGDLYVGSATGGRASVIVHGPMFPWAIGWSRDSRRVFYQDDKGTWTVNRDGTDPVFVGRAWGVAQQFTTAESSHPSPIATTSPTATGQPAPATTNAPVPVPTAPAANVLPADPPVASSEYSTGSLAFDASGNLYISDCSAARIYRVVDAHTLAVVVGSGPGGFDAGFGGDGGPATRAEIFCPFGLLFDAAGDLVLSDHGNSRIRVVAPTGIIQTIAGAGHPTVGWGSYGGDGGPAINANMAAPQSIAYGPDGTLYITDRDNNRIRAVGADGVMTTIAGGASGYSGDGGPAAKARMDRPDGLAVGSDGTIYFTDSNNERIRMIAPDGLISTIAGTGKDASSGDGGQATKASLADPEGLLLDSKGNLYVSESEGNRVRVITPDGTIRAFAGTGQKGDSGDAGPATAATLDVVGDPGGLAIDAAGTVYISTGDRIRAVDTSGVISTFFFGDPAE
jgi:sugar lactone lactonase YvrE